MLKLISRTHVINRYLRGEKFHLLCDINPEFPPVLVYLQGMTTNLQTLNLLDGTCRCTGLSYKGEDFTFINNSHPFNLDTTSSKMCLKGGLLVNIEKLDIPYEAGILACYPSMNGDWSFMERKYLIHYSKTVQQFSLFENLDFKG